MTMRRGYPRPPAPPNHRGIIKRVVIPAGTGQSDEQRLTYPIKILGVTVGMLVPWISIAQTEVGIRVGPRHLWRGFLAPLQEVSRAWLMLPPSTAEQLELVRRVAQLTTAGDEPRPDPRWPGLPPRLQLVTPTQIDTWTSWTVELFIEGGEVRFPFDVVIDVWAAAPAL